MSLTVYPTNGGMFTSLFLDKETRLKFCPVDYVMNEDRLPPTEFMFKDPGTDISPMLNEILK